MNEKDRNLEVLKDILFTDDREYVEKISKRLALIEKMLNEENRLAAKINPIIKQQLKEYTKSIPDTLGATITETLRKQARTQKDEVVDAIYPILGKMTKKYIGQEIIALSERIDKQFNFFAKWKLKIRALLSGETGTGLIMQSLSRAKVEQVFLVDKNSGILKASYSRSKTIDEEMISGMLTAIKSFVEDAFMHKDQNLELIEYELYRIHLQSFVTHYIAVVISGNYDLKAKGKLQDIIFNFYNSYISMNVDSIIDDKSAVNENNQIDRNAIEKELALNFGNAKL